MKLEILRVNVLVTREESDRMDKWAIDTCNGVKVREILQLPSGKLKKVFRFHDTEWRKEFIEGLEANFGESATVC